MLDERLTLAFDLYPSCDLAADIGTDHAHLPAALLRAGRCRRMILTDISESALTRARREMDRCDLMERVSLRLGNGLLPLQEPCQAVSVMGMGGRTIHDLLLAGSDRLLDADLILSAHSSFHLVRQALALLGYGIEREDPCRSGGRFYLVVRARHGLQIPSAQQQRIGSDALFESVSPCLKAYLSARKVILECRLRGLYAASQPDQAFIDEAESDLAYYRRFLGC